MTSDDVRSMVSVELRRVAGAAPDWHVVIRVGKRQVMCISKRPVSCRMFTG
jgi:hypothetical protein